VPTPARSYDAAADDPDLPEDPSDLPEDEPLVAGGVLSPLEDSDVPAGDEDFSVEDPDASLEDPVDSDAVVLVSFDDVSLAAGRLSFL
jgi:hypothetical protein